jgi:hypothetical protein
MSHTIARISDLVLDHLSRREMRVLSLVVAIRKGFEPTDIFKGDLTAMVKSALRKLVADRTVVDVGGIYTLARGFKPMSEAGQLFNP